MDFRPKQRTVKQEQSVGERIIEPAQGEEKARLERYCTEYLQDPGKATVTDFVDFTRNMISLIGGTTSRKSESGVTFTSSGLLVDQETRTSIVLVVREADINKITTVSITAESAAKTEELGAILYLSAKDSIEPYFTSANHHQTSPGFRSYITGKEVPGKPVFSGGGNLQPDEAKGFAQKVFDVYQRRGQQPQTQTQSLNPNLS